MSDNTNKTDQGEERLRVEYKKLKRVPIRFFNAEYMPSDAFEWHFIFRGPEGTPYDGGFYHGTLTFPSNYPSRAPLVFMKTPTGLSGEKFFVFNTCVGKRWDPSWPVDQILNTIKYYMVAQAAVKVKVNGAVKRFKTFAEESIEYNLKDDILIKFFPDDVKEMKRILETRKAHSSHNVQNLMTKIIAFFGLLFLAFFSVLYF